MTAKTETPRPSILLLYLGLYQGAKKVVSRWRMVTEQEYKTGKLNTDAPALSNDRLYERKTAKWARPGQVYRVDTDPEAPTTIYVSTLRFIGDWPTPDDRVRWAAEAKEIEMELDAQAAQKAADDPLVEQLAPVRAAYRRAVGHNKSRLLAAVVEIIVGGGK